MPENKLDDEKVLRMFVDRLIADKGGDTLDVKQKEILQKELLEELGERIQQAMIRALPDAKLMELEKLLDEDAPDEAIEGLFKGAGMDFDPAIRKAMDEFRTDYFKDKIRVSVKTSILEAVPAAAVETPKVEAAQVGSATSIAPVAPAGPAVSAVAPVASAGSAAPVVAPATQTVSVAPAVGQPVQGAVSAVPGQSNVEGVANAVSAAEQGRVPAVQTQVVAQGANTTPAQPAASAIEQPLQAAPNLMDALNAATAGLNTTVNMNSAAASSNAAATNANVAAASASAPMAGASVDANTGVNANTNNGANAIANTDMTGKEA